jgi:hypothetical protein
MGASRLAENRAFESVKRTAFGTAVVNLPCVRLRVALSMNPKAPQDAHLKVSLGRFYWNSQVGAALIQHTA